MNKQIRRVLAALSVLLSVAFGVMVFLLVYSELPGFLQKYLSFLTPQAIQSLCLICGICAGLITVVSSIPLVQYGIEKGIVNELKHCIRSVKTKSKKAVVKTIKVIGFMLLAAAASIYTAYGMYQSFVASWQSIFPQGAAINPWLLHCVMGAAALAVFLLTYYCIYKSLNKLHAFLSVFLKNKQTPMFVKLVIAMGVLLFMTALFYLFIARIVLSHWLTIPLWSYAVAGSVLACCFIAAFVFILQRKIRDSQQPQSQISRMTRLRQLFNDFIDSIDQALSLLLLVFHAFGGEGSIAAFGIKQSGVGGRFNGLLAFGCLASKGLSEFLTDMPAVVHLEPHQVLNSESHTTIAGVSVQLCRQDNLSHYKYQVKLVGENAAAYQIDKFTSNGENYQVFLAKKPAQHDGEKHSHDLHIVRDILNLISLGLPFINRLFKKKASFNHAGFCLFWLGLSAVWGVVYGLGIHHLGLSGIPLAIVATLACLVWKKVTEFAAKADKIVRQQATHPGRNRVVKLLLAEGLSLLAAVTALTWGLLGGIEFVHVMHLPISFALVIALVSLMVEYSFYTHAAMKIKKWCLSLGRQPTLESPGQTKAPLSSSPVHPIKWIMTDEEGGEVLPKTISFGAG